MNAGTVCSTRIKFFPRHFRESELCFFSRLTFFRQSAPIRSVRQSAANPQRSGGQSAPIRCQSVANPQRSGAEWRHEPVGIPPIRNQETLKTLLALAPIRSGVAAWTCNSANPVDGPVRLFLFDLCNDNNYT